MKGKGSTIITTDSSQAQDFVQNAHNSCSHVVATTASTHHLNSVKSINSHKHPERRLPSTGSNKGNSLGISISVGGISNSEDNLSALQMALVGCAKLQLANEKAQVKVDLAVEQGFQKQRNHLLRHAKWMQSCGDVRGVRDHADFMDPRIPQPTVSSLGNDSLSSAQVYHSLFISFFLSNLLTYLLTTLIPPSLFH